jgi:hypothetical protein
MHMQRIFLFLFILIFSTVACSLQSRPTATLAPLTPASGTGVAVLLPTPTNLISPDGDKILGASLAHLREIVKEGARQGKRADAFSKIGDSITASTSFLAPYGTSTYNLGQYADLQSTIEYFSQAEMYDNRNPFTAVSQAAGVGWTTTMILDPNKSNPRVCQVGESPLVCEYLSVKPSIALIMLGTNDVSSLTDDQYENNMRQILTYTIEQGIVPVISTIPDRDGYESKVQRFNQVIMELAGEFDIPLWDYAIEMQKLPNKGLSGDGAHPSVPGSGNAGAVTFDTVNLQYGYTLRNLMALQVLDTLLKKVILIGS